MQAWVAAAAAAECSAASRARCISRNSDGAMPKRRSKAWPSRADDFSPTRPAIVLSDRPFDSSVRAASSRRSSTKCAGVLPVASVNLR